MDDLSNWTPQLIGFACRIFDGGWRVCHMTWQGVGGYTPAGVPAGFSQACYILSKSTKILFSHVTVLCSKLKNVASMLRFSISNWVQLCRSAFNFPGISYLILSTVKMDSYVEESLEKWFRQSLRFCHIWWFEKQQRNWIAVSIFCSEDACDAIEKDLLCMCSFGLCSKQK